MNDSSLANSFISYFLSECKLKNPITLAASSTFFFILCLIPFSIIIFKIFTLIFAQQGLQLSDLIINVKTVVPDEVYPTVQYILKHVQSLNISSKNTGSIHNIILIVSSLSFFGSIWKALEMITEEKQYGTITKTLKSVGAIIVSSLFFLVIIAIPTILKSLNLFIKQDLLIKLNITQNGIFSINFISAISLFIFFIAFFKYILQKNAKLKSIILGSLLFTVLIIITKFGFISYLMITKTNLMGSYGSLYSGLIFLIWIFISILAFYAAIIFSISHSNYFYYNGQIQI